MEPGGDRGAPLDGDGGAPALVEVADGEDAVLVAGLGEGVLDFLEELRQPGRRDGGDRLAQSGGATGRAWESTARHPVGTQQSSSPPPLTSSNRITVPRLEAESGYSLARP